jgi:hypothetical protein
MTRQPCGLPGAGPMGAHLPLGGGYLHLSIWFEPGRLRWSLLKEALPVSWEIGWHGRSTDRPGRREAVATQYGPVHPTELPQ